MGLKCRIVLAMQPATTLENARSLLDFLQDQAYLSRDMAASVAYHQTRHGGTITQALMALSALSAEDWEKAFGIFYDLPIAPVETVEATRLTDQILGLGLAWEHQVCIISADNQTIHVVACSFEDVHLYELIMFHVKHWADYRQQTVLFSVCAPQTLRHIFAIPEITTARAEISGGLETLLYANDPQAIPRFVDALLLQALSYGASDIHIDPKPQRFVVRIRIDGVLHPLFMGHINRYGDIVNRLKILASLDIAEKRRPQSGHFAFQSQHHHVIDVRLSTLPTIVDEVLTLRLLDRKNQKMSLAALGFSNDLTQRMQTFMQYPHGIFLVCGPTGSGKSTTLHALMGLLPAEGINIMTLEDPVEIRNVAFRQTQVTEEVLDFGTALRSFLRHDPDVLMIGEIRDAETAQMCLRAALTGHLVLATVHAATATSALYRLHELGMDKTLLQEYLIGVLNQRLVRRLCDQAPLGYRGRIAVAELTDGQHVQGGTLAQDAEAKIAAGITNRAEITRVFGPGFLAS